MKTYTIFFNGEKFCTVDAERVSFAENTIILYIGNSFAALFQGDGYGCIENKE